MDEQEFCRKIMGIVEPWVIGRIQTSEEKRRVDVYLEYPVALGAICPVCGKAAPLYDKREERVWRELDTCKYQTYLHCRMPRANCDEHGIVTMNIPWSTAQSHFTNSFESHAIELLKACKNRSEVARLLELSWDQINGIMGRSVKRGLDRRGNENIAHLGIDEKSFLSGQRYATVLTDTDGRRVLDVVENRDKEAVKGVFKCLNSEQRQAVKAISMDFWQAFVSTAEELLPNAEIVHDKFHIMKYMNEAVNKVRVGEHKWRRKQKDATLTGTKYLWLKKLENFTDKDKEKWATLKLDQLEVGKAWNLKELLGEFWTCDGKESARKMFASWFLSATHSGLDPVVKVAKMLKTHLEYVLTWWQHRITNSYAEGINSVIQEIKTVARGFRNFANYRTAILFFCGKLDLCPQ
ncbi:MAG: ISL3 family transposase [Treponematales bacterium]